MADKEYTVRFFKINIVDENEKQDANELFMKLFYEHNEIGETKILKAHDSNVKYTIRDLYRPTENYCQGVFVTLRDDAPSIRTSTGKEKRIELQDEEGIMEKNHFMFFKKHNILVWQQNDSAARNGRFSSYLSGHFDKEIELLDIFYADSWKKLKNGSLKKIICKFSAPKNKDLFSENEWGQRAFEMMGGANAGSIEITLSANRGGVLHHTIEMLRAIAVNPNIEKLHAKSDQSSEIIDLLAERISSKIVVKMDGKYPDAQEIFREMYKAKESENGAIDEYFGDGKNSLI